MLLHFVPYLSKPTWSGKLERKTKEVDIFLETLQAQVLDNSIESNSFFILAHLNFIEKGVEQSHVLVGFSLIRVS